MGSKFCKEMVHSMLSLAQQGKRIHHQWFHSFSFVLKMGDQLFLFPCIDSQGTFLEQRDSACRYGTKSTVFSNRQKEPI